jgi:cardiolipin synthase (CMP-forming)
MSGRRTAGTQSPVATPPRDRDRVLTIPNLLSLLRLLGVPLFCWLLLGPHADVAALCVLAASSATDWLDGRLARALNQTSRLGALLDPAADRLYVLATLVSFVGRHIIPWWLAVALVARDVVLGVALLVLRRHGIPPLEVTFVGKAATLCLLYGFPLLLLGSGHALDIGWALPLGWAFTLWGFFGYWWAGMVYLGQVAGMLRAAGRERR